EDHRGSARVYRFGPAKRRHDIDRHPQNMKKIPSPEQDQEMNASAQAKPASSPPTGADAEDAMAGLQADLDRFRDLAARSQADFENYKKRASREKEEAIKYANSALLHQLVSILDNFELGLAA